MIIPSSRLRSSPSSPPWRPRVMGRDYQSIVMAGGFIGFINAVIITFCLNLWN